MNARLVALDEGPDIDLDRAMVVVGRHPACDARLDSLRVSRHHCCMMPDNGELLVRDLGSTNGIRINGQRVEIGRLRVGDELSIAHIRYRLDAGVTHDRTLADSSSAAALHVPRPSGLPPSSPASPPANGVGTHGPADENALAAAVRKVLPSSVANRCKIEVIVRMDDEPSPAPHSTPVGLSSSHADRVVE
jgi:predicted component of type VI protein secretion system